MDEREAFKEKLKTINFGIVPGGFRDQNSTTMWDREALPDLPTKEEVQDRRSRFRHEVING